MYWQDDSQDEEGFVVPDNVVDLAFSISCKTLPVDHAWALSRAVVEVLPWLEQESGAGLHLIHVAESGNGWERPEEGDALLYLSRRTKLTLRVPRHRLSEALQLSGKRLDVDGHPLEIGDAKSRLLSTSTTLYARHLVLGEGESEEQFLAKAIEELRRRGLRFKKVLCGKSHDVTTPEGLLRTVSLMVSDLQLDDAVRLQEEGLGAHQHMGCGLFIPHKSV